MQKITLVFMALTLSCFASSSHTEVSYKEVKRMHVAGSALFLDARGLKFYKKGTILGALNMPLEKFKRTKRLLPVKKGTKIITFCNGVKCKKSVKLAEKISALGYSRVMVYRAGYPEWFEMGQDIMMSNKYCQSSKAPKRKAVINGAEVYLGSNEGTIDTAWFIEKFKKRELPENITLIDIRRKKEFDEGHLPDAINIRWDADKGIIDKASLPKGKLILLYCNTGLLSSDAYDSLDDKTAKRVLFLDAVVKCKGDKCTIKSLDR